MERSDDVLKPPARSRRSALRAAPKLFPLVLLSLLPLARVVAAGELSDIKLWTNGVVNYRFDDGTFVVGSEDPVTLQDRARIRTQMTAWETALTITDPQTGGTRKTVEFRSCGANCSGSYLVIRYNRLDAQRVEIECNNMSEPVGMEVRGANGEPDGVTVLNLRRGTCSSVLPSGVVVTGPAVAADAGTNQSARILLHELGHVLGLWHEFNRADADRWLIETPELDGAAFERGFGTKADLYPVLGNYDYDSIMTYGSGPIEEDVDDFTDYHGYHFSKATQGAVVSPRDVSRLLQYYARERYPLWGFFTSISETPDDPDDLPNPYLAHGVEAVGTPAIATQSPGSYDVFARGSDDRIYWKKFRGIGSARATVSAWASIGCCFASDPSAVSRMDGRLDVAAISTRGEVMRLKYIDGVWFDPLSIRGGPPSGGIKEDPNGGYVGPAIASRATDSLDVYAVRSDGLLSVSTWENGNWASWRTLGANYSVTARPAAVALSSTEVQLAIGVRTLGITYLYEPKVTYRPAETSFTLGTTKGRMADQAPPAVARRDGQVSHYRVVIVNRAGRISHHIEGGEWLDVGGIPLPGTGVSTVATGGFQFLAVMNGEAATGCQLSCPNEVPPANSIPPGGLWIRNFE